jgi:hypothetical protein
MTNHSGEKPDFSRLDLGKPSRAFRAQSGRIVRAMVADGKGGGFHPLTFPEDEIRGVEWLDERRSALLLRSGGQIAVALPLDQLERKIYTSDPLRDDGVIDLRDLTGAAAVAHPVVKVAPAPAKPVPAKVGAEVRASAPVKSPVKEPVPAVVAPKPARVVAPAPPPPPPPKPKPPPEPLHPPELGEKVPDGTIYAGVSPDTGRPMYVQTADAPRMMDFDDACVFAARSDANGRRDWRVPSQGELAVLFNNRAKIGGFNVTGMSSAGWYWTSDSHAQWQEPVAWKQRFSDGTQDYDGKQERISVRCVRS